jgi:hypothetical protein
LAGPFGSVDAFDEEVVGVGLALVGPRGFADIHNLDTKYATSGGESQEKYVSNIG